jgi:7-cyano-7-deazaguanine synthase in queuosine biosynthesis
MSNTTVSLMFSGGLDSLISYHFALKTGHIPQAIHVDLGHPYSSFENEAIKVAEEKFKIDVTRIDMKSLYPAIEKRLSNQIIPSRNVLLATIGSMFNSTVWINALDGEANGKEHDKSYRFFADSSELLSFTNSFFQDHTNVTSPFLHLSKAETIKWALENSLSKEDLFNTVTCYSGTHKKCGRCLTCVKRYMAFKLNGVEEPGYDFNPLESPYAEELAIEMQKAIDNNDHSRFNQKRIAEWLMLKNNQVY